MLRFSQPTLGLVRDALERLPSQDLYTPCDKFWKQKLFDSALSPEFIELASSVYSFNWTEIVLDLFAGKFGDKNSQFGRAILPSLAEDTLNKLASLALTQSLDAVLVRQLRESLAKDGFSTPDSDSSLSKTIPGELEALPRKETLLSDLKTRLEEQNPLVSLLYIDLDNFKAVNDQLGHDTGDKCLTRVVGVMRDILSGKGTLYRLYKGDEFCALLSNFSATEAGATAERIRAGIDAENPGDSVKVTCSIGVASCETAGLNNADAMVKAADDAMYVIKHGEKNGVSVYSPSISEKEAAGTKRSNPRTDKKELPQIEMELERVYIEPLGTRCVNVFVLASGHNLNATVPTTIKTYELLLRSEGKDYVGKKRSLKSYEMKFDGPLHMVEDSENLEPGALPDLADSITDSSPLRRGIPAKGWLLFFFEDLWFWPYQPDGSHVTAESVSLTLVDAFGERHTRSKTPPWRNVGSIVLVPQQVSIDELAEEIISSAREAKAQAASPLNHFVISEGDLTGLLGETRGRIAKALTQLQNQGRAERAPAISEGWLLRV